MFLVVGSQDFSAGSPEEVLPSVQETSIKRLVVGPLDVRLHSSAVHRILKMVTCAMDHEYEPYCKPQPGQPSAGNSCTGVTGLTLTFKSQPTSNRSLYYFHSTIHSCLLYSVVFYAILFIQQSQKVQQLALYDILITLLFLCTTHLSTHSCTWK